MTLANSGALLPAHDHGARRLAVWGGTAALMLLPVLPERLNGSVAFDIGDFMFLTILLVGVGTAYELAVRMRDDRAFVAGLGIAIATILIQAWINLAVGVIGSEDNPANWIYAGVLAIAVIGAIVARFRPASLTRVMILTAFAQLVAMIVALAAGLGFTGPITVFFCALWLISARLFRRASNAS